MAQMARDLTRPVHDVLLGQPSLDDTETRCTTWTNSTSLRRADSEAVSSISALEMPCRALCAPIKEPCLHRGTLFGDAGLGM